MSETTLRRSLEQERATFAYQCVQEVIECKWKDKENREKLTYQCTDEKEPHKNCAKYKAYVKKIPMLIKTNGLAATFAYVKAKSDQDCNKKGYAYHLIYQQTEDWLRKSDTTKAIFEKEQKGQLIQILINQESPRYRQLSTEVMALFVWLKRAAEGLIEGEDENQ